MKSLLLGNSGQWRGTEGNVSFGLITQRSVVQIHPPQPTYDRLHRSLRATTLMLRSHNPPLVERYRQPRLPISRHIPANISSLMARCTPRGPSFFFSSEIGHTRRSYRVFDQHRRPSGEGLAFGHSSCDKNSSASRRNQLTT